MTLIIIDCSDKIEGEEQYLLASSNARHSVLKKIGTEYKNQAQHLIWSRLRNTYFGRVLPIGPFFEPLQRS